MCAALSRLDHPKEKKKNPIYGAAALSRLDHPNIIKCYGVLQTPTKVCMLTEFVDGT